MRSLCSCPTSAIRHLLSGLGVTLVFLLSPKPVSGQYLTRPQIPWRTISTARFDIHFPAEMEEWTRVIAQRMESVADGVDAVVGNKPASRITVIVEDPSNVANGFALPFMEGPVIFLWPTPPSPSPTFGSHRGWGEVLAVHEYGHIAHLTFPARNPRERLLWKLMPVQISPVTRKSPAWVIEGYATLIEGQLTGSGRPYSSGRAAVLRQWALDGRFPTYGQLNAAGAFLGGNMRYLVGSAFLEWLQQRKGDSSLVHLWRRMSARQDRSFEGAFAGVFGAAPADLYGAFTVDVMDRSLQVRARLRAAGLAEGELVQRLVGGTGEPAVSPNGSRLAIVLRSLSGPSRLVVWSSRPDPDSALRRARERLLRLDPLDVAPFDSFPRPRRALATLHPASGRSHEQPRWMPDGVNVLVSRDEPAPNGVNRPDLFMWNTRSGAVRRVTRGASIRQADPSPDGRQAVGVRCHAGSCSIVLITLQSGAWRVLVAGSPELVWHRPRYSPDGSRIAASYQVAGQWGVAVIDAANGSVRRITTDDGVSRYSPIFTPSGRELLVVSELGGIANLEIVPADGGPSRSLTRVTGAVLGPEVSLADSSIWFLSMRSGGYDLRRLASPDEGAVGEVVTIQGPLAPAAPPTLARAGLGTMIDTVSMASRDYGLGPRRWRFLPGGTAGPDGHTTTLMAANIDPIGRLSIVTQGAFGSRGTWRGGSAAAALRRTRLGIDASAWYVEHEPSLARDHLAPPPADVRYAGVGLQGRLSGEESNSGWSLRVAASAGRVKNAFLSGASRLSASGEARARLSRSFGRVTVSAAGGLLVETGDTDDEGWQRTIGTGTVSVGTTRHRVRADWLRGSVTAPSTAGNGRALEHFVIGGAPNPLIDPTILSQRISLPAVPAGFVSGQTVQMIRGTLGGATWEPYWVWVAAGESPDDFKRIAGIERNFAIGSLGFARLPGIRARAGAAYSFDEPYKYRARAYASLTFTP
jgi:Tol biopolymer transport system component